uniref:Hsp90 co chaperone tebp n=1 Tax=Echinococcus granulosus TaxID=6210 RepID=A0A068WDM4_ECHGR|nr:hsp90 co chaperone tebp [Echinococcus granulosus]
MLGRFLDATLRSFGHSGLIASILQSLFLMSRMRRLTLNPSLFISSIGRVDSPTPTNYELKFDFYAEVDPKKAVRQIGDRVITYCVEKKESSVWPRLLKDSSKQPWLKTDFSRWKDLDDSDSDGEGGFGGFGGAGGNFQDMLSMMGNKDLGEEEEEEEDSDDDELPDLEDPAKPKAEESEIPVLLGLCAVCLCINYCTSSHRLVS